MLIRQVKQMASNKINEEFVRKGYLKAYLANRGVKCVDYDEWERLCECIDDAKPADICPCDVCRYNPPSSRDGKPCTMCPAQGGSK